MRQAQVFFFTYKTNLTWSKALVYSRANKHVGFFGSLGMLGVQYMRSDRNFLLTKEAGQPPGVPPM